MQVSLFRVLLRRNLIEIGIFSFVLNLLVLVQPIYMLQVYDRVLTSANTNTLYFLTLIAVAALALMGVLEIIRQNFANRMAARLETSFGARALMAASGSQNAALGDIQPLRDLSAIRAFTASKVLFALYDLPFAPLFLVVLYFVHPGICLLTIAGIAVLAISAWLNQYSTMAAGRAAAEKAIAAAMTAQAFVRSAETVRAMGMGENALHRWGSSQAESLKSLDHVASINSFYGGFSRALRIFLQIATLGLGGYYVLQGEMTGGMIFASSIVAGKALQPLDQLIASWPQLVEARNAWRRLKPALSSVPETTGQAVDLPAPKGDVQADGLVYYAPNAAKGGEPLLKRLTFRIPAGDIVGIVGPSGAGKSTLARLLVGAIDPSMGTVRIDSADIKQWDRTKLGAHVGYLAQEADMLPGTIAENIARFAPGANDEEVVTAAKMANVHEMILGLPGGYNTMLGPNGLTLSGGQRQRIGLARAFFGNPRFIVLDEPNANLDADGDAALDRAMLEAKKSGATVVIVTQRKAVAERVDKLMIIRDGAIEDYGPKAGVAENQNRKMQEMQKRMMAAKQQAQVSAPEIIINSPNVPGPGGRQ
jgi:PrtD family type I secretion system ABC transporter